jgi:hypothetical protein
METAENCGHHGWLGLRSDSPTLLVSVTSRGRPGTVSTAYRVTPVTGPGTVTRSQAAGTGSPLDAGAGGDARVSASDVTVRELTKRVDMMYVVMAVTMDSI